jgi:hypothetical protein
LAQAPSAPAPFLVALQAWQAPVHGESQHTPSTQWPLTHWVSPAQATPLARSDWQVWSLARQNAFATHWLSAEQVVAHDVASAQKYGLHELDELTQVPEPLHSEPVTVPFAHVVAAQGVLAEALTQELEPLQVSPVAQLRGTVEHSLSGSVPAAMLPQVPFAPEPFLAALQAWQVPLHAVLQHTPSTQKLMLMGQIVLPQQLPAAMHCDPQQKLGERQHWLLPSQCGSVGWQSASATLPSCSSSGGPEAHAYRTCAKISAHQTANLDDRARRLFNPVNRRANDSSNRQLVFSIARDPI